MVVMTDCESLNIKDNMIFRFFCIKKKPLVFSCLWQLGRHWKEGNAAKLESACKDRNL